MQATTQSSGNYIHKLQMALREQYRLVDSMQETYAELVSYLSSPKFYDDTTVQVADVLRRLEPLREALLEAQDNPVAIKPVIATGEIVFSF